MKPEYHRLNVHRLIRNADNILKRQNGMMDMNKDLIFLHAKVWYKSIKLLLCGKRKQNISKYYRIFYVPPVEISTM